ncbi:coil containing protein [Vibrio phage 1.039.O._10N.286.55.A2]|nr:coil containing protein [Vibrio phage 1.039.O._10N.286.55.A2]
MINFNTTNAFDSMMGTVGGLQQVKQNSMNLDAQRQQQQAAAQQQEQQQMISARTQELMPLVKSGDYDATIELSTINPQIAEAVTKAKASMKEGQEAEIASWLAGYQTAPDKEAYIAQDNPNVDIDDNFRGMEPEQRESLTKIVGAQVMPKDMFNATFGGQPEAMTAYQQATIDTKKVDQDLRKLEIQQKSLDAQYKRETDELKRSELEQKIEANKTKSSEVKQQDQSRISEAIVAAEQKKSSIDELVGNSDYMDSISGFANYSKVPEVARTTVQNEAAAYLDNIKNSMTLENLGVMSGPLTDTDIKIIASASSKLRAGMSEKVLKQELTKIQEAYDRVITNYQKEANRKGYSQGDSELSDDDLVSKYL